MHQAREDKTNVRSNRAFISAMNTNYLTNYCTSCLSSPSARRTAADTALSTAPALPKLGLRRALASTLRTVALAVAKEAVRPRPATFRSRIRSSACG